jgi:hypothetical protein
VACARKCSGTATAISSSRNGQPVADGQQQQAAAAAAGGGASSSRGVLRVRACRLVAKRAAASVRSMQALRSRQQHVLQHCVYTSTMQLHPSSLRGGKRKRCALQQQQQQQRGPLWSGQMTWAATSRQQQWQGTRTCQLGWCRAAMCCCAGMRSMQAACRQHTACGDQMGGRNRLLVVAVSTAQRAEQCTVGSVVGCQQQRNTAAAWRWQQRGSAAQGAGGLVGCCVSRVLPHIVRLSDTHPHTRR